MSNEMIINATDQESRVALVEKGTVSELYIERIRDKGIVGNVYKGKVVRVLPGMQAAFVDIGLEKAAFLYAGDVYISEKTGQLSAEQLHEIDDLEEGPEEDAVPASPEGSEAELREEGTKTSGPEALEKELPSFDEALPGEAPSGAALSVSEQMPKEGVPASPAPQKEYPREHRRFRVSRYMPPPNIADLLKEGQEILVQVTKNPIGTKGARLTMHLSIPGRNLVLMPSFGHVGVSRRIGSDKERRRLKDFIQSVCPPDVGVIVRTACEDKKPRVIKADLDYLLKIWREIEKDMLHAPAPYLLHEELDIVLRTLRDMFIDDIDRIVVDSKKEHKQILRFLEIFNPAFKRVVKFYKGREPIFDTYGIETEINRAMGRRVWLKSGGYIIVDQAEALTVVDVNTGRYVGKKNFEDTILKINLEAAREIAYQLRLRNCGGIIIIDFIDMERSYHREKVYRTFEEVLRKDRAKNSILKISELGLIEMTRKRTRESLIQTLCAPCFYCEGKGYLKNKLSICYEIFRELAKFEGDVAAKEMHLFVHPEIAKTLKEEEMEGLLKIEKMVNKKITVEAVPDFHIEQFEIKSWVEETKTG
ncbi:MAG: Rne/Rng family ribonuclease [Deltaproteobacteria bacterium]|nr:Rne/Rng family ribonuclease [Deltaproteobacteria bacterium]